MAATKGFSAPRQGGASPTPSPAPSYPTATAARDLSAHRVIILTNTGADYPAINSLEHGDAILGLTRASAVSGASVAYQFEGKITDPSWNWTVGPLFCGDNGVLTQSVPSGKWLRQMGEAVGTQTIQLNLFSTYYLTGA